jgi:hypothetical protein
LLPQLMMMMMLLQQLLLLLLAGAWKAPAGGERVVEGVRRAPSRARIHSGFASVMWKTL